jgi:hypothetical protein
MRQVFAQSQQPARRQRVGLTAREERAHDFRAEIGQPNKRSEPALIPFQNPAHIDGGPTGIHIVMAGTSQNKSGHDSERSLNQLRHLQHTLPSGVRLGDGRRRLSSVFKQVAMAAGLRAQILFWSFHGRAKMRGRMPRPARIVEYGARESDGRLGGPYRRLSHRAFGISLVRPASAARRHLGLASAEQPPVLSWALRSAPEARKFLG